MRVSRSRLITVAMITLLVGVTACTEPPTEATPRSAVQLLTVEASVTTFHRVVGFQLGIDSEQSGPVFLLDRTFQAAYPPELWQAPTDWPAVANSYLLVGAAWPTAGEVTLALEALPQVGQGGVKVTGPTLVDDELGYRLVFDQPQPILAVTGCWTMLPQEVMAAYLAEVDQIEAEVAAGGRITAPPEYTDVDAWIADLRRQASEALGQLDSDRFDELLRQAQELERRVNIERDPDGARAAIRASFPRCPVVEAEAS